MLDFTDDEAIIKAITGSSNERREVMEYLVNAAAWKKIASIEVSKSSLLSQETEDVFFYCLSHFEVYIAEGKYKGKANLKTLFSTFCKNRVLNLIRTLKRKPLDDLEKGTFQIGEQSEEAFKKEEKRQAVKETMKLIFQSLDEKCKQVLMEQMKGFSNKEIAQLLGVKEQSVKNKIRTCKLKIMEIAKRQPEIEATINDILKMQ